MSTERLSLDLLDLAPVRIGLVDRLRELVGRWRKDAQGREALAKLSPYMLRDIGLNEADVWRELHYPSRRY
jgi:uncharacterized protein YjiS (DUF1127 family)